jgi:DNA-binding MarR family transcriptional regulator
MADKTIIFEDTLSYELAKLTTAFRNSIERQMAKIGLHGGQIFVLLELWKKDGQRQVDIAESLNLSAPTVNKMLRGLIEVNLVVRERIEDDARATRIFLTDAGYAMRGQVEDQWGDLEATCRSAITDPEKGMLIDMLARVRAKITGTEIDDEDE